MPLAGSRDSRVLLWDPQAAAPVQTLEGHKWQVSDLAIGADGTIISSSLDGCGLATRQTRGTGMDAMPGLPGWGPPSDLQEQVPM